MDLDPLAPARHLAESVRTHWKLTRHERDPVIVYQMGKVGSTTITRTLEEAGVTPVFQVHTMSPDRRRRIHERNPERPRWDPWEARGKALYSRVANGQGPADVVTLVREPVARNVSAYFERLDIFGPGKRPTQREVEAHVNAFLNGYRHEVPLRWFDDELASTLGIDVYEHRFPAEEGWTLIEGEPYRVLVIKLEIPDPEQARALSSVVEPDGIEVSRQNVSDAKAYAEVYDAFEDEVRLPGDYVDRMHSSRYAQHFYTERELAQARRRWTTDDPES